MTQVRHACRKNCCCAEKQIEYVATLATSGFGTILKWRDVRIMWAFAGEADMVQTWHYVAND
jgi:hypothetical protein